MILAAVLSRAINGSAAFFATLGGGMVLVALHRLFAFLTFYSHRFGILAKEGLMSLCAMENVMYP